METAQIEIERWEAHKLWRKYREHRAWSTPIDHEIERVYSAIAKGKVVIKALESIAKAGVGEDGFPKLAISRADQTRCVLTMYHNGGARMAHDNWIGGNTAKGLYCDFPEQTFTAAAFRNRKHDRAEAIVPHIPPDIRPARGLANYHILFEAIWSKVPPYDPMLLRRIGKGDLWLVVGAWDLTEVERAAMASRIGVR
ncbi:MAG TPA: hypothetical protein VK602_19035 [Phyllobacterium sp.]|nr:hypothetical protein [Phyllobacterium sp.]